MTCCDPTIIPFNNVDEFVVTYTDAMREMYGNIPTVQVYIGEYSTGSPVDVFNYILANIRVAFVGLPATEIRVYNGGLATGFLKISK